METLKNGGGSLFIFDYFNLINIFISIIWISDQRLLNEIMT